MIDDEINVKHAVDSLFRKLKSNPFLIWSEADLQTMLSIELQKFDTKLFETSLSFNGHKVKTNRIHREYICNKPRNNIDIVIFSQNDIKNINDTKYYYLFVLNENENNGKEYRPVECSHLIEIKTNLSGVKGKSLYDDICHDFKKLRKTYIEQKLKPELHYIFFIRWNIKKAIESQKTIFRQLYKEIDKEPKIQFHLFTWPEDKWKNII